MLALLGGATIVVVSRLRVNIVSFINVVYDVKMCMLIIFITSIICPFNDICYVPGISVTPTAVFIFYLSPRYFFVVSLSLLSREAN